MKKLFIIIFLALAYQVYSQEVFTFAINQPAAMRLDILNDTTIQNGAYVQLGATWGIYGGDFHYTVQWLPVDYLLEPINFSTEAHPSQDITYTVTVTDGNNCMVTDSVAITVEHFEAIGQSETVNLVVYPNPANTKFRISPILETGMVQVTLYTYDGKQLWQKQIESRLLQDTEFSLPDKAGIYLVEIKSGTNLITRTISSQNN